MCHVILFGLPLLALASWWVLPWTLAVPTSIALVAAALVFYGFLLKVARRPAMIGVEALLHLLGQVRSVQGNVAWIWVNSELWSAEMVDGQREGDKVEVVAAQGLKLRVRKLFPEAAAQPNRCSP